MNLPDRLARVIPPYALADGPPPRTFGPFARWALAGAGGAMIGATVIIILAALTEIATAWFTGWAIDRAISAGAEGFSLVLAGVFAVGFVLLIILRPILFAADSGVTNVVLTAHLFPLILSRVNRYTLGHSMRYFENDFAGRIAQKEVQTANALTLVVTEVLDIGVYAIAMFVAGLMLMAGLDPRLLLVFAVWGVVYVGTLRLFIPEVRRRSKARAGARASVSGQIVDTITNIATVKLFAENTVEDRAAEASMETLRLRSIEFGMLSMWFRLALTLLSGVLPFASILGALWLWSRGVATAGDVAMVSMVSTRLGMVTNRLGRTAVIIYANIGEVQDGIRTLTPAYDVVDAIGAEAPMVAGEIRFEDVRFSYGGAIAAVDGIDLTIAPGEKVALVGASGAGKSTLVSLLLRLYDVEGGRITLGGTDIRAMTQSGLRRLVSVVRQDVSMFNRPASDNIRYGSPDSTEPDVIEAAKAAEAHDFIQDLRDHEGRAGYAAYLGERGVKLSGGQRQRIALARAILKDAPILVLDEATSALDSEVEASILETLYGLMDGKTVIAIAHRLSTIAQMDRIIVIDGGRIVEDGGHEALLAHGGLYAGFWTRQSGGFIGTDRAAEAAE
ncbi:MAG: ABC transporter ATP-binding protein [Pseudomonadota bacterium]